MGAQQSSRRITVVSDEASGVIKISDSVVSRLKEEIEGASGNGNQQKQEPRIKTPDHEASTPIVTEQPSLPVPENLVPEAPVTEGPETTKPLPPPPEVISPSSQKEAQAAETVVIQDPKPQRPIIHYVEEPSLSSLKIRAEKEKELNDLDNHWRKRMQSVEQEKTTLSNLQAASIAMSVKELEDLLNYKPVEPVCQSQRNLVTQCLNHNKGKPLNCGDYVKEFSNCVNSARLNFVERSG